MTYLFETEEHAQLRENVRRFAQKHVAPHAHAWEEACEFPRELYRTAAEAGLLGISYPVSEGGAGGDVMHALAASEEMVLYGHSVGTCVGLNSHGIALPPIVRLGTARSPSPSPAAAVTSRACARRRCATAITTW